MCPNELERVSGGTFDIHAITSLIPLCHERATTYISIRLQVLRTAASSM